MISTRLPTSSVSTIQPEPHTGLHTSLPRALSLKHLHASLTTQARVDGMRFPPSPALSICDSLDGIDDLDAFLDSQKPLSHFPTPPLKRNPFVDAVEVIEDQTALDEEPDHGYIASLMAEKASIDIASPSQTQTKIQKMLTRSELPSVLLAFAFNILNGLHKCEVGAGHYVDSPPDLLVLAALSLAVSYTYDTPVRPVFWSRTVSQCTWTKARIDKAILRILLSLDFSLHKFGLIENLDATKKKFEKPLGKIVYDSAESFQPLVPTEKQPLKVVIDGTASCWENGQLTPDDTPTEQKMPEHKFLRLL